MIYRSSFRIDIIKIIKKELKFVTEKHSERIEEYRLSIDWKNLREKKFMISQLSEPVIRQVAMVQD